MPDIASLGFEVDTSGLERGTTALERLGQAGNRAGAASDNLGAANQASTNAIRRNAESLERQRILTEQGADAAREFDRRLEAAAAAERELAEAAERAARELEEQGQAADDLGGELSRMSLVAGAVGAALAAIPIMELTTYMVDSYRAHEKFSAMLRTSFQGDVGKAAAQMKLLLEYSATTPYTMDQAVEGFTLLKNLGLDPGIEAMRSYGNTATAMGKDLTMMIEAVADATRGEYERLQEFGIIAEKEGEKVKVTFQGVTKEIDSDAKSIQKYLQDIGNVQFADAMAEQMSTLDGFMSNLSNSAAALSITFVEQSGIADNLKSALRALSEVMTDANRAMMTAGEAPAALTADLWAADPATAIARMKEMTLEFKTASDERRVAIRNEMMDFYGMLQDRQAEFVDAIQSSARWLSVPGLSAYAERLAQADGQRLAATTEAINAVKEAFKETGTAAQELNEAQRPIWEDMVAGANRAANAMNSLGSTYQKGKANWLPQDVRYSEEINQAGSEFNVDPKLIQAVMSQESEGKIDALSPKGATGLMQLMPTTAAQVAKELDMTGYSMLNASDNIRLGVAYLSQQLVKYDGNIEKALAAYNAGPGAVDKYNGVPPYKETQNYVAEITANYRELTGEAGKARDEQERLAKKAADAQVREAKKAADAEARESKKVATEQEREAKKAADARIKEEDRVADNFRKQDEENFQLSMQRQLELMQLRAGLNRTGMSKTEAYGSELTAKGYDPADVSERVSIMQETEFYGIAQSIQEVYFQASMTGDAFERWSLIHKDGLTPAMVDTIEAMKREAQAAGEVSKLMGEWGSIIDTSLVGSLSALVDTGDELLDSLIAKLIEAIVTSKTLQDSLNESGSGGIGSVIANGIGSLFGFATGGSFTVGGSGGTDSKLVAFRATPGERVSVATPAQQARSAPDALGIGAIIGIPTDSKSTQVNLTINNQGVPVKAQADVQQGSDGLDITILLEAVDSHQAKGIRSGNSQTWDAIQSVSGIRRSNY